MPIGMRNTFARFDAAREHELFELAVRHLDAFELAGGVAEASRTRSRIPASPASRDVRGSTWWRSDGARHSTADRKEREVAPVEQRTGARRRRRPRGGASDLELARKPCHGAQLLVDHPACGLANEEQPRIRRPRATPDRSGNPTRCSSPRQRFPTNSSSPRTSRYSSVISLRLGNDMSLGAPRTRRAADRGASGFPRVREREAGLLHGLSTATAVEIDGRQPTGERLDESVRIRIVLGRGQKTSCLRSTAASSPDGSGGSTVTRSNDSRVFPTKVNSYRSQSSTDSSHRKTGPPFSGCPTS